MNYREYLGLQPETQLSDTHRAYIAIYDILKNKWSHLDNNIVLYEPSEHSVAKNATVNIIRFRFTVSIEDRVYQTMYGIATPVILAAIDREGYVEHIIRTCLHDAMDAYIGGDKRVYGDGNVAKIPPV